MKQCTLGIIYGLSAHGLASRLKISEFEARKQQNKFLSMFPTLKKTLIVSPENGAIRGYVSTSTGLKRYRTDDNSLSKKEKNWMNNMPVQGTAAALFKLAGNRLHQLYKSYGAKLILAVHDAFIFEAPLDVYEDVANLTQRVMIEAVQEMYPELRPRADVNISNPNCWNKDGDADSIDSWTHTINSA